MKTKHAIIISTTMMILSTNANASKEKNRFLTPEVTAEIKYITSLPKEDQLEALKAIPIGREIMMEVSKEVGREIAEKSLEAAEHNYEHGQERDRAGDYDHAYKEIMIYSESVSASSDQEFDHN